MKVKTTVLVCLVVSIVLPMTVEYSRADSKAPKPVEIGVVSILRIFQNCRQGEKYREAAVEERTKTEAELEKLSKEIEAEEAGLRTLKAGSDDYLTRVKQILTRKASLQAQQEFYKQQAALKEQQWAEKVYKDILRATAEVAKKKGLDIVLEKDEPEFPLSNYSELMTVISTHKVLYSSGCVDISDEVMARLDAEQ
jgi:Skp family chaperone for outer membrane proteins